MEMKALWVVLSAVSTVAWAYWAIDYIFFGQELTKLIIGAALCVCALGSLSTLGSELSRRIGDDS